MSLTEAPRGQRGGTKTARIPIKVAPVAALPKPVWIRVSLPLSERFRAVKRVLRVANLHTVCEEASCPNIGECFGNGTHYVDMLTIGQYLQPRPGNLPVRRYVAPEAFADLARQARQLGFTHAACGPLVRSSYHADQQARAAGVTGH